MLERLADIERRYEELSDLINDPEIIADNERADEGTQRYYSYC